MKFKVGDLAITQNSSVPLWNDNLLVVVTGVVPGRIASGILTPYDIRRVDGQPFGSTKDTHTGEDSYFVTKCAYCKESNLKKAIEEDLQLEESDVVAELIRRPATDKMRAFFAYKRQDIQRREAAKKAGTSKPDVAFDAYEEAVQMLTKHLVAEEANAATKQKGESKWLT
jgi:hypothetical protein